MKNVGWLLALGAGYIGYKLLTTANNLSYLFTAITLDKQNTHLLNTTLKVTLRISNPGDQSLSFTSFVGSLTNNGTEIARVDVNSPVTLQQRGQTEITFPVQVNNLSVAAELLDTLIRNATPMVTITGVLTAGEFRIPISQQLPVSLNGSGIGNVPVSATKFNAGLFCLAEY